MRAFPTYRAVVMLLITALLLTGCGDPGPGRDSPKESPTGSGTTTAEPGSYQQYVALGDSYTSAPGVPPMAAGRCARSLSNYPNLLAVKLEAQLNDRSCGGAAPSHLVRSQHPGTPPQFTALNKNTDLVTMGIGANPTIALTWFTGCTAVSHRAGTPCRDAMTADGTDTLLAAVATARPQIVAAVDRIHALAPEARVVLVGYPQIFPLDEACPELPIAPGDLPYADQVLRALNQMLQDVAAENDADFADVYAATNGHDICAQDAWIQGKDSDPEVALYFHPRVEEQEAVADLLAELLRR